MTQQFYKYIVIGAGLAGASAIEGIREVDPDGSILLLGSEKHPPYHRPPLSKQLWPNRSPNKSNEKSKLADIFIFNKDYFLKNKIHWKFGTRALSIDREKKSLTDNFSTTYHYHKLLLTTGGEPRVLDVPGGNLSSLCYFRTLDDFTHLFKEAQHGKNVLVVGGGLLGCELAEALTNNGLEVTMLFPESTLCAKVFPEDLGRSLLQRFREHGIHICTEDRAISFEKKKDNHILTRTFSDRELLSDLVVVSAGISPEDALGKTAGLLATHGYDVNESGQTSDPDIYAAGDCCNFPCAALNECLRFEHWEHAKNQGKLIGRNAAMPAPEIMAPVADSQAYTTLPSFSTTLCGVHFECIGDLETHLVTTAEWDVEYERGILYYLGDGKIRGVITCNIANKMNWARELITTQKELRYKAS
ncbi:FAD-dependent oxidoreductase [Bdellovibrionota bacterium FG-2]